MNLFKKYELCLNDAPVLKKHLADALDINLNILHNDTESKASREVLKTITISELNTDFENSVDAEDEV